MFKDDDDDDVDDDDDDDDDDEEDISLAISRQTRPLRSSC